MPKLSKRIIDAEPTPESVRRVLSCSELPGFGIRLHPPSKQHPRGRRVFFARIYIDGCERKFSLGEYGVVTLEQARRKAMALKLQAAAGELEGQQPVHPSAADITVRDVCAEYYHRHLKVHRAEKTHRVQLNRLEKHIYPRIGTMRVADLTRVDVERLHQEIGAKAPGAANRVVELLRAAINWGRARGFVELENNPADTDPRGHKGVIKFRERKLERHLSHAEIARLHHVLDTAEKTTPKRRGYVHPDTCSLIRMLMYTGARFGEINDLTWEMVDLDRSMLMLPKSKEGGEKTILLMPSAVAELRKVKSRKLDTHPKTQVFGSYNPQRAWRQVVRREAGLDGTDGKPSVRLHDLRHTYASHAATAGVPLAIVGKLLGHSSVRTTQRYAHFASEDLRNALSVVDNVVSRRKSDDIEEH